MAFLKSPQITKGTGRCFVMVAMLLATFGVTASAQMYNGIGGYDLKSPADMAFAFDYNGTGKMDHIVLYRPGTGTVFIEERVPNTSGGYDNVFSSFSGIGGYDLLSPSDRLMAFDYDGTGKADHILCYRPGTGTVWILKNQAGVFTPVFLSFDGIGGYDLQSTADQIIAFDYDGSGRYDHLVCYRPGTGTVFIVQNQAGTFTPEVSSFNGIGGYDLKSPSDRLIAFDYYGYGTADHLAAYRPGSSVFYVLENTNGSGNFTPVQTSTMGVGGYDLLAPQDQLVAYDYTGTGSQNYLIAYRPGTGTIFIIGNVYNAANPVTDSNTVQFAYTPVFQSSNGIGGYDLQSTSDQIFAFDYNSTGLNTALALYRPGYGAFFIETDTGGQIATTVAQ